MTVIMLFSFCLFLLFPPLFSRRSLWYSVVILFSFFLLMQISSFPFVYSFLCYSTYQDSLSFFLIYLSVFILLLMTSSSINIIKHDLKIILFIFMLAMLGISLILCFLVTSVLSFYFFFEFSLVPTMFLIMVWGYQVERIQSVMYFLIYTLLASLPFLVLILKINDLNGSFDFSIEGVHVLTSYGGILDFLVLWMSVAAFLFKLPMFFFHLWLPKAHVEAPVSGSMILAGVLLKLGGYGFIRVGSCMKFMILSWSFFFMSLSILSIIFISLNCLRSNDLKSLIAYSSVAHMGLALTGLFTLYSCGLYGSVMMLVGHGICSSGLFSYVNMMYERSMSRSLLINKGSMAYGLMMAAFMFILSIFNMGAPPSMNLFSELLLVASCISFSQLSLFLLVVGSLLVAGYSMVLFSNSHHGKLYINFTLFSPIKESEYLVLTLHCLPLSISFIFMNLMG